METEQVAPMNIADRLQALGHGVISTVSSVKEAVEKAAHQSLDLVLMDISTEKGMEIANQLQGLHNVPVIHVSSDISTEGAEHITSTHPFGCIIEPFEDTELSIAIEMALYRHTMEETHRLGENKYRTIIESIEEAYFEVNLDGKFTFFNDALCRISGFSRKELMGMSNLQYVNAETARRMNRAFKQIYRTDTPLHLMDYEITASDGTRKTVEISVSLMKDSSGKGVGFRGVARDVTERKLAEETLRKSEERYRALFENNPIETIIVNRKAMITGYNQEKITSGNRLPRPGDVMYRDYAGRHWSNMYAELMECIRSGVSKEFPDKKYGDKFLYIKISPFPEGAIITSIDVTERKRVEETLAHMATHDPLTGLFNRALFDNRLSLEIARSQRSGKKLAVMLLDLDHFKQINDSWGHAVGDKILQSVSRRLGEILRKSDTIARMGGDEFMILLPDIKREETIDRIALKILDGFKEPFSADAQEISTTTSLGIAVYPDDGREINSLMKNADMAMYKVKEEGRNGFMRYDATMSPTIIQKDVLTMERI